MTIVVCWKNQTQFNITVLKHSTFLAPEAVRFMSGPNPPPQPPPPQKTAECTTNF